MSSSARRAARSPLAELGELVERETGIRMPPQKSAMLEVRLQRRLRALGLSSLSDYRQYLHAKDSRELPELIDAVTTNKTDFYREPQHFEFLSRVALPQLTRAAESHTLKVWCAGCSTGEEAYTLAMVLSEHAREWPRLDFRILATDISNRVLAHAKRAIYPRSAVEPLPQAWRERYVAASKDPQRDAVRIRPELRKRVSFHWLNFMTPSYALRDRFDVIFFRNVAIYFDHATQLAVVEKLHAHLAHGGYFFMGLSESVRGCVNGLTRVAPSIFLAQGS